MIKLGKRKLNLYIVHGDEYRSRVGSIYEEDTFFRESYLQAGKCVKEIIEASRRFEERTARSQYAGDGAANRRGLIMSLHCRCIANWHLILIISLRFVGIADREKPVRWCRFQRHWKNCI